MLTHVGWGFGNGSTTINVPDRRGIISRGAGVHGSRAKAAGGNYDGGAPGHDGQDMSHAHLHETLVTTSGGLTGYEAIGTAGNTATNNTQNIIGVSKSDGANGTPRMGNETTGAWTADILKTRIF